MSRVSCKFDSVLRLGPAAPIPSVGDPEPHSVAGFRRWVKPRDAKHAAGRIARQLRHKGFSHAGIGIVMLWSSAVAHGLLVFGGQLQGPGILSSISRHGGREQVLDDEPGGCARMLAGSTIRKRTTPQCARNGSNLVRFGRQQTVVGGKEDHHDRWSTFFEYVVIAYGDWRLFFRMLCGENSCTCGERQA